MTDSQRNQRIEVSNKVILLFAPETSIFWSPKSGILVSWSYSWRTDKYQTRHFVKRWCSLSGTDHYPTWYKKWPHGGTCCMALSQLVRWCRGKPVLPLSSWKYWASERFGLFGDKASLAIETLLLGAYPQVFACVLCGRIQDHPKDWWHLGKVTGPICSHGECRRQ